MSNIVIVGGTGFAGSAITAQAASRGHKVTSLSRSVPSAPVPAVTYQSAKVAEVTSVPEDTDVIIGALSPRGDNQGTLVDIYTRLASVAGEAGARLIVIGGFGSLRPAEGAPRFAESGGLPPEYAAEATEMNSVRAALEDTPVSVDWTFVSPAATFGPTSTQQPQGHYRTGNDVAVFDAEGNSNLAVADLGLAVIDEIENPSAHRAHISFAY